MSPREAIDAYEQVANQAASDTWASAVTLCVARKKAAGEHAAAVYRKAQSALADVCVAEEELCAARLAVLEAMVADGKVTRNATTGVFSVVAQNGE